MIQKKIYKNNINELLQDVLIITLTAILFFLIIGKLGGYAADKLTKVSCNAINERYVPGDKPGYGICVKSTETVDIKVKN